VTPAPEGDRDHSPHIGIECEERHKRLFGDPIDRELRTMGANVGDQRKCVNNIAERRRTDDEDGVLFQGLTSPVALMRPMA